VYEVHVSLNKGVRMRALRTARARRAQLRRNAVERSGAVIFVAGQRAIEKVERVGRVACTRGSNARC